MRLYDAICGWLEAHATQMSTSQAPEEHHPEGNNFTRAEHAHCYTSDPELHAGHRGQSIDADDGGAYRLGFQPNPRRRT